MTDSLPKTSRGRIARAAGLMSVAVFISRILGYVRDMVLAYYLGASGRSDSFLIAFRIPNLLRELFAEGSMSAGLIPVLKEYQVRKGEAQAKRLARIVFAFIVVVVGMIVVSGIIFAPAVVRVLAPNFLNFPDKFSDTVLQTRIMFPFVLFISLSALLMGVLNTRGIFFIPALSSAGLNVGMIAVVIALSSWNPMYAAALGMLFGGFLQFAFQVPSYLRQGYDFRPVPEFRDPGLKKIGMLILPTSIGMAVAQINIIVSSILASYLPEGSISYLFYSMHLIQFPIGMFGVTMALAVLPALSEHALKQDFSSLRSDFSFALRLLFFITLPAMAGLIALREPIVSTLYMRGDFDYKAVAGTAGALLFYSTGIWAMAGARVLASTFYSMQNTRTPMRSAVTALTVNLFLSLLLMGPMEHRGLALANAAASMLNFGILFYALRKRLRRVEGRRIAGSFGKALFASAVMGTAGFFVSRLALWRLPGMALEKALWLIGTIALSVGLYALLCYLLKSEELGYMLTFMKERFRKTR